MEVRITAILALLFEGGKAGKKCEASFPNRQHGGGLRSMFAGGGRKTISVCVGGRVGGWVMQGSVSKN